MNAWRLDHPLDPSFKPLNKWNILSVSGLTLTEIIKLRRSGLFSYWSQANANILRIIGDYHLTLAYLLRYNYLYKKSIMPLDLIMYVLEFIDNGYSRPEIRKFQGFINGIKRELRYG